jgi:beta-phosphoglucomutase-like phosphatase (HAD superfamily)
MSDGSNPYGLIFDVDGLLADTEPVVAKATIDMFRALYGIDPTPEDFLPFVGTGAVRYVEGVADKYGVKVDMDKAVDLRQRNYVALLNEAHGIAFPGVHDLVDAAAAAPDFKLSIATSSFKENSVPTLRAADIDPRKFDAWITGSNVTHKKPDPEIYLFAANAIGVPPERCVVVEDALVGVEAARRAGMKCVAVTNTFSPEQLAGADLIVASLEEVDLPRLRALF